MDIHIKIEGNTAYLEEQVHLVCENTGYLVFTDFSDDWRELRHAVLSYWHKGVRIVEEKVVAFEFFALDKFPNTDKITLRFYDYIGHNTNEIVIPCLNSIIDNISKQIEPHEDVYNGAMEQIHQYEGGA